MVYFPSSHVWLLEGTLYVALVCGQWSSFICEKVKAHWKLARHFCIEQKERWTTVRETHVYFFVHLICFHFRILFFLRATPDMAPPVLTKGWFLKGSGDCLMYIDWEHQWCWLHSCVSQPFINANVTQWFTDGLTDCNWYALDLDAALWDIDDCERFATCYFQSNQEPRGPVQAGARVH